MKILINFKDNDFGNTFLGVAHVLKLAHDHRGSLPEDKDKLCDLVNGLLASCYILFQSPNLSSTWNISSLNVSPENIKTGMDAEDWYYETPWGNGEYVWINTDSPEIKLI
jgi:hypothetical protein